MSTQAGRPEPIYMYINPCPVIQHTNHLFTSFKSQSFHKTFQTQGTFISLMNYTEITSLTWSDIKEKAPV